MRLESEKVVYKSESGCKFACGGVGGGAHVMKNLLSKQIQLY